MLLAEFAGVDCLQPPSVGFPMEADTSLDMGAGNCIVSPKHGMYIQLTPPFDSRIRPSSFACM